MVGLAGPIPEVAELEAEKRVEVLLTSSTTTLMSLGKNRGHPDSDLKDPNSTAHVQVAVLCISIRVAMR
jgi:hypothetical protein